MSTVKLISDSYLKTWQADLESAKEILHLTHCLAESCSIRLSFAGLSFLSYSATEFVTRFHHIIQYHQISLAEIIHGLNSLMKSASIRSNPQACPVEIDLISLIQSTTQGSLEENGHEIYSRFVDQLAENRWTPNPRPVVLFGFGRIGRLLARILTQQTPNHAFYLAAIVVRGESEGDLAKRISLINKDSVHGAFPGLVELHPEKQAMLMNGQEVLVIYADHPAKVNYQAYGIENALIVDNTGKWRDAEGLGLHLQSPGASQVLLTAPGKGDIPNIVFGINHQQFPKDTPILSAASCTTNAICPVLSVIDQAFGINYGHVETVHAYTSDQNLLDNYHKADRRGRSAALNMVIAETGAAKAVAKVLPHLGSKLTGNAVRVPVPDVSLAILKLDLAQPVTKEQVNQVIKQAVMDLKLNGQLGFSEDPDAVSTDFLGTHYAAVVDLHATIVNTPANTQNNTHSANGHHAILYVWYDNEYGYSVQLVRLVKYLSSIK